MVEKLPSSRIVGAKQTIKAIKASKVEVVYIAENADQKVIKPIVDCCKEQGVEVITIPTMQKLGLLCNIDVGAATACIIKE
ncbi:ribosomal L7Ae/L30e/S12e/Gadd45 family protein [Clostridium cylindrosporum]|uniref:Ribosomal protein L7Ae/L30e/S12e/gadd45 family n=1 Tax=Clostridium cylindrosporum DSM 605 TaxID=1121307 RepID=A0A0J8DDT5_CLOCY|nr:ribosomal L7Ae/L30e/S12e/Gadd45 family protein [Clostridium cylindrosporum]KMT22399.1 ribosomal protein L7Ae/L30e/S12e/gadd45 family [Clostridium cylindrosporum DSM 605]